MFCQKKPFLAFSVILVMFSIRHYRPAIRYPLSFRCRSFSPMRCSHVLLESVLLVEFLFAFNTYLSRRFSLFHCLLCLIIKFSVLFQHIFRRRFKSALVTFYAFSHISYRYCDCFIFMDTVIVSLNPFTTDFVFQLGP